MLRLSQASIIEKNKLATGGVWLLALEAQIPGSPIYLVNNTEDLTLGGQVYTAFPFSLEDITEDSKELPNVKLTVSNVTGTIQRYVEEFQSTRPVWGATTSAPLPNASTREALHDLLIQFSHLRYAAFYLRGSVHSPLTHLLQITHAKKLLHGGIAVLRRFCCVLRRLRCGCRHLRHLCRLLHLLCLLRRLLLLLLYLCKLIVRTLDCRRCTEHIKVAVDTLIPIDLIEHVLIKLCDLRDERYRLLNVDKPRHLLCLCKR